MKKNKADIMKQALQNHVTLKERKTVCLFSLWRRVVNWIIYASHCELQSRNHAFSRCVLAIYISFFHSKCSSDFERSFGHLTHYASYMLCTATVACSNQICRDLKAGRCYSHPWVYFCISHTIYCFVYFWRRSLIIHFFFTLSSLSHHCHTHL